MRVKLTRFAVRSLGHNLLMADVKTADKTAPVPTETAEQVAAGGAVPVDPAHAAESEAISTGNAQAATGLDTRPEDVNVPGQDAPAAAALGTIPDLDKPRPVGIVAPEHRPGPVAEATGEDAEARPAVTSGDKTEPV